MEAGIAVTTEEEVCAVRSVLRLRLKRDLQVSPALTADNGSKAAADGSLAAATQLEQLFERTVQFGENQSGLLLGAVGSNRRVIVTRAMRNLRNRFGNFTFVYLNGVILQNELEAFKELTAQLTLASAVKHPVLSYWNMYEYLRGLLVAKARTGDHVIVILDSLEQFVRENSNAKQLLLYNLLDWLQAKDIKMGVLGITDNYNVVDNLEKRVRSRFSNLQIVIERPSFTQIRQHLSKTSFLRASSLITTSANHKLFSHLLEQDHQLAVLETVTEHGIALLIGMGHLEKADQRVFTLEMVYARWENFLRQHDMLAQLPTRSEAQKALENLLRLKLVKDAGDAFKIGRGGDSSMKQDASGSLQPEFRAVHLNFAPRTLEEEGTPNSVNPQMAPCIVKSVLLRTAAPFSIMYTNHPLFSVKFALANHWMLHSIVNHC
ncbi:hypothetical protein PC129_g3105 [Phytophthora cactorum]|uniref:Origin recognition complex subunit 4 C-terminal domain-containing protein n=1 Tax=Phytophthora cactorum TaxID=29920 RepID=A0A8T1GB07_9STRA|nr:hypothetical protein PC112_g5205 [Phytophthora cactorum]KAG2925586.1 hypothetical protein PC114_g4053 [Phytophthora cactorum]KAG2938965.1 hypothetical protein PC115_g3420 [Phytophthora cactorum]KAG2992875.1 hypothetical protein PC118_g4310 [Phytophthora cactorum]KAG3101441.1 hypothetical protein PC122_g2708 [Phytophthora cactorum]